MMPLLKGALIILHETLGRNGKTITKMTLAIGDVK